MANHAAANFRCLTNKKVKESEKESPNTDVNRSPHFLEHVLDIADTLANIMIICGIHKCKARGTIEITMKSFLHYDEIGFVGGPKATKRLRKEDIFLELGKRCMMDLAESHLSYDIIKRAFAAFYFEPATSAESAYVRAARKTAQHFTYNRGLFGAEKEFYELKINSAYKKFWYRMRKREQRMEDGVCRCPFCTKREHVIYGLPPCADKPKLEKQPEECLPKEKIPFVHAGRVIVKCKHCGNPLRCCTCPTVEFGLEYVKSLWNREDFDQYYTTQIQNYKPGCKEWKCVCPETKGCRKGPPINRQPSLHKCRTATDEEEDVKKQAGEEEKGEVKEECQEEFEEEAKEEVEEEE